MKWEQNEVGREAIVLDYEKDQGHSGTGSHNAADKDLSSKSSRFSEEQGRKKKS